MGTRPRIFFGVETASERPVSFASLSSHTICRRRRQKSAFFLDPSLSFALYARAQSKKIEIDERSPSSMRLFLGA